MKAIFDLDGTIALIDHRRHLVKAPKIAGELVDASWKPDWDEFYRQCKYDKPNTNVIEILQALDYSGIEIMIFSGRSEVVRKETEQWLGYNEVPYKALLMRPEKDFTPDEELKKKWLADYDKDDILCVFDDRTKVVSMYRREGLICFQVTDGNY